MDPDPTLEIHPDPLFYYLPSQWFVAVYELFRAYWRLTIIKSYIYIHILLSKQYIVLFLIKCCFWRDCLSNKNITIFCLNRYWTMNNGSTATDFHKDIKSSNPGIRTRSGSKNFWNSGSAFEQNTRIRSDLIWFLEHVEPATHVPHVRIHHGPQLPAQGGRLHYPSQVKQGDWVGEKEKDRDRDTVSFSLYWVSQNLAHIFLILTHKHLACTFNKKYSIWKGDIVVKSLKLWN